MEQSQRNSTDNADIDEQFKKALELFNENKFSESSDLFSKILEIKTRECDEKDPSLAKYYYHYGQSLLYEAKSKSDIFGDSVAKKIEEHKSINNYDEGEEEEQPESEIEEIIAKEDSEVEEIIAKEESEVEEIIAKEESEGEVQEQDAQDNAEIVNDDGQADGEVKEKGDEKEEVKEDEEEEEEEGVDNDEDGGDVDKDEETPDKDTLELAWEILEVARSLASQDPKYDSLLSDIYISLGEIYIENEFPDKAQEEFLSALKLRMKLGNRRGQAEAYFMLSIAQELAKDSEKAIENLENAKKVLKEENEINKIEGFDEMIKDIDEKIETINAVFTAPEVDPFTNEKFDINSLPESYTTTGFSKPTTKADETTTVILQPRKKRNREEDKVENEEEKSKIQKTSED